MEKIFSKCGMRCDLCLIYRPNVEKEDRRIEICTVWKKYGKALNQTPIQLYVMGVVVKKKLQHYLVLCAKHENV